MRKIEFKEEKSKRKRRNQIIVGLLLVLLMFLSVAGYAFVGNENNTGSNKLNYNGFEFFEQEGFWILDNKNLQLISRYNPKQINEISVDLNPIDNYYGKPLYIFSESEEAESEIYKNFQIYVQRFQRACIEKDSCQSNIPIKTCEDNFIIIQENENAKILQKNNCVMIQGPSENLTMITDEFLFNLFKIR